MQLSCIYSMIYLLFVCTSVDLHIFMCIRYNDHVWPEGSKFPRTGDTDAYELPYECWEANPIPLVEQ